MTKPRREKLGLVQSWVPQSIKDWAKRQAKKRGLSLAAWLRTHLIEQREQSE